MLLATLVAQASGAQTLQPFAGAGSAPLAPWRVVGLPHQTKPFTRFGIVDDGTARVLRVEADRSYGNLVHALDLPSPPHHLAWRWRLDQPIANADLRRRSGDDLAIKVCTMWDMPLERVPFWDRQLLRGLRASSDDPVPAATVCYVWDQHFDPGVDLPSPFTGRLRYVVLRGVESSLHHWESERRDIVADFLRLFGKEAQGELPPLMGVAVGADADNTRSHSAAEVADLKLEP